MAPAQPGEVLLGKYRVDGPLGAGGMGVVMRATHMQLGQPVALKFLIVQGGAADAIATDRFLREAKATFRLKGENSVRVLDVGTSPTGTPFIVMELLEGCDLRQLLNERRFLPAWEAVGYILQVCSSLEEAHAHGIVHRDLKPRNLFLTSRIDGSACVKVLDFGISKVVGDDNPLTNPQMALGSPRYMAPEQWMSSTTVDARADIYATAMVLHELVTGQVALAGLPLGELIRRLSAGAIPSPRDLRPELPEPLCKVILKAMRPHPDERYPSIQVFAQALREVQPPKPAPRSKQVLAQTAATAVVDKEVMLARAALTSALGPPRTQPRPAPTAQPVSPQPAPPPPAMIDDFDLKTTVGAPPDIDSSTTLNNDDPRNSSNFGHTMHSPGVSKPFASTLPIQQMPPELAQALASRSAPQPAAPNWQPPQQQQQQQQQRQQQPQYTQQQQQQAPQPHLQQQPPQVRSLSPMNFSAPRPEASYSQPIAHPSGQMQGVQQPQPQYTQPTGSMPPQQYASYAPQRPTHANPQPQPQTMPIAAPPPQDAGSRVPWLIIVFVFVAIAAAAVTLAVTLGGR